MAIFSVLGWSKFLPQKQLTTLVLFYFCIVPAITFNYFVLLHRLHILLSNNRQGRHSIYCFLVHSCPTVQVSQINYVKDERGLHLILIDSFYLVYFHIFNYWSILKRSGLYVYIVFCTLNNGLVVQSKTSLNYALVL